MAHIHVPNDIPVRHLERSRGFSMFCGALFLVGVISLFVLRAGDPARAEQAYVANWLFFFAVAEGAMLLCAVTTIVKAKWNWSVRRVSLAFAAYLPIAFILFLPMLGLRESYFPWIEAMESDPIVQAKAAYLNIPFLVARNVAGLLLLIGLSLYGAYLAVRPDMGLVEGDGDAARKRWRATLTAGWMGQEAEETASARRMGRLAPAFILVYAAVMSMVAYDFAMSLEPHWFSTIFGAWYFMGGFWGGIASTALIVVLLKRRHADLNGLMGIQQMHDLGKLTFAFCVFWTYIFFAQYIVIWYGKLPWEQAWIVHRTGETWGGFSLALVLMCFVIPFAGLIGRRPKMNPAILGTFVVVILGGLWLEHHLLIAPSLRLDGPTIGAWEGLVTLVFLGPLLWSLRWFLSTFPVVQVWQPPEQLEMVDLEVTREEAGVR